MTTSELGPLFTILTSFGSAVVAAAGLGVWIMTQFDKQRQTFYTALSAQRVSLEDKIDDQTKAIDLKVDGHEKIDQKRHEDNIKEFGAMRETLARMGAGVPPISNKKHY